MDPISPGLAPHDGGHVHGLVKTDINGKNYEIPSGNHEVAALKKLANIPLADELERVVNQRLVPLPDNGVVDVTECSWFVSHPRDCQSS